MQITNRKGLPQALVAACANDPYDPGSADISITRLLAPPRQVALMKQHAHELTEDVADRIWALRSQGIHAVLERAAGANEIAEVRWERQCLNWRVSGKLDLVSLADGCLTDWKDTSVWSIKDALDPKTEGKKEWEQQVNLLAYFGLHNGYTIKAVQVVAFGRDWTKNNKIKYGEKYPDAEVSVLPLPLWDQPTAQRFLEERVALHQAAQGALSKSLPLPQCSPVERWERFQVKAGQRNLVSFPTRAQADAYCIGKKGLRVEWMVPRCQQYCSALPFCEQGQRIVAAMEASA